MEMLQSVDSLFPQGYRCKSCAKKRKDEGEENQLVVERLNPRTDFPVVSSGEYLAAESHDAAVSLYRYTLCERSLTHCITQLRVFSGHLVSLFVALAGFWNSTRRSQSRATRHSARLLPARTAWPGSSKSWQTLATCTWRSF